MGVSASVHTYFGIEAPRSVFFAPTGDLKRVCSAYVTEHQVTPSAKFCDQCGSKTAHMAMEVPTEAFKAFCVDKDVDPLYAFYQLQEGDGCEWSDQTGTQHTIGWHKVQAFDNSELKPQDYTYALGFKLGCVHAEGPNEPRLLAYSLEELSKLAEAMREIAEAFQLTGVPKLYAQVYFG
jgi:hypothetical protein